MSQKRHLFKCSIFAISFFLTALSGAQEIGGCRILSHLTITQIIRSCKDVTKDKLKTDGEVAHAASQVASLLKIGELGTPEEIIGYYLLSAQKGNLSAFAAIGDIYRAGYKNLKPDYKKAKYYYFQDTSYSPAHFKGIAEMLLYGHGLEKSVDDAIQRFRFAASLDDGDAKTRRKLCEIFSINNYQKRDIVKAHFWCSSAVEAESDRMLKGLYESARLNIEMQLSESQLIESNNLQQDCRKFGILGCKN
jgi:hypothetical protein